MEERIHYQDLEETRRGLSSIYNVGLDFVLFCFGRKYLIITGTYVLTQLGSELNGLW